MKTFYKQLMVLCTALFLSGAAMAQSTTETFEDETGGSSTFTSGAMSFTLGNDFLVSDPGFDWGYSFSSKYVDNANTCSSPGTLGSISTTDGSDIYFNSFWLLTSPDCGVSTDTADVTISWYKDGSLISTKIYQIDSEYNGGFNGYHFVDFDADNQSCLLADEIRITTTDINYLALDDFSWSSSGATTPCDGNGDDCSVLPSNVAASNITDNSATISWGSVENAQYYELWNSRDNGKVVVIGTSYEFTGLTAGTEYTCLVRKVGANCNTDWSSSLIFSTTGSVPCSETPSNVASSSITASSATITWDAVSGASSYDVWNSNTSSYTNVTETSYNLTGLSAASNYTVLVRQRGSGNCTSSWSSSHLFTTTGSNPCSTTPTGVSTESVSSTSATITWDANIYADGYQVWDSYNSAYVTTTENSRTLTDLTPGTQYAITVRHVGNNCTSGWATTHYFTTNQDGVCGSAPTGLASSNITESSATITWDAVSGATYRVWESSTNGPTNTGTTNSIDLTGLSPATTYNVLVKNIGNNCVSDWSSTFQFTTTGSGPCDAGPTGLNVINNIGFSADIIWDATEGASGYYIWTDIFRTVETTTENISSYFTLQPGNVYNVYVKNFAAGCQSSYNNIAFIAGGPVLRTANNIAPEDLPFYEKEVEVYPNPTTGNVNLAAPGETINVEVYDMNAIMIMQSQQDAFTNIDLSGMAPGLYTIKVTDDKGNVSVKRVSLMD